MRTNHLAQRGALAAIAVVLLLVPEAAFAATVQGEDIGKNLGDLLAGWAAALGASRNRFRDGMPAHPRDAALPSVAA